MLIQHMQQTCNHLVYNALMVLHTTECYLQIYKIFLNYTLHVEKKHPTAPLSLPHPSLVETPVVTII